MLLFLSRGYFPFQFFVLGFDVFGREKIYHNTSTGKTGFGGITVSPLLDGALELEHLRGLPPRAWDPRD